MLAPSFVLASPGEADFDFPPRPVVLPDTYPANRYGTRFGSGHPGPLEYEAATPR